jgi:hypothetical protein
MLTFKDIDAIVKMGAFFFRPKVADKHGRIVNYMNIGRLKVKEIPLDQLLAMQFFLLYYHVNFWPLTNLRNGMIQVVDASELSLGNLDMHKGKELQRVMAGLFFCHNIVDLK